MTDRFWTDEKEKLLAKLWEQDLSAREMAAQLGCTRNAVLGKANRLGLPYKQKPNTAKHKPAKRFKPKPSNERKPPKRPDLRAEAPADVPRGTLQEIYENLPRDNCRWIYGSPVGSDFGFCTNKQKAGHSWCESHFDRVFVKVEKNEREVYK